MTSVGQLRLRSLAAAVALLVLLLPGSPAPRAAEGAVPRARCGAGSSVETGLQGQVPKRDRDSGRSARGYRCNLALVGRYPGQGSSWVSPSTGRCAYLPQAFPASVATDRRGVQVVDARDERRPRLATTLTSPAFLGDPWESLKVNERRRLLAGTFGGPIEGTAFFDLYDVSDCARPRLLNSVPAAELSLPANALGHEGAFSPDGRTYWATGGAPGVITAIDVSDPALPKVLYSGVMGVINHGPSFSPDGRRMYLSTIQPQGLTVADVSGIQDRRPLAAPVVLSTLTWADGANGQHSVPVTWGGRAHLVFVDEMNQGAVRVIDVQDPARPRVVSKIKLQIQLPAAASQRAADSDGSLFNYEAHYCAVDRVVDPTAVACGMFQSGVRVFDVRNPLRPREIAYYVPGAQAGRAAALPGSQHAQGLTAGGPQGTRATMTTDWCSSPPRFVGRDRLWVTCQDSGFLVLRFTGGAFPLR